MVNACAELPDPRHPVHAVAAEQKKWVRDLYAGLVGDGTLADQLLILHEGAIVAFSVAGVRDATAKARAAADALLP
jgi:hypothetical protein